MERQELGEQIDVIVDSEEEGEDVGIGKMFVEEEWCQT